MVVRGLAPRWAVLIDLDGTLVDTSYGTSAAELVAAGTVGTQPDAGPAGRR